MSEENISENQNQNKSQLVLESIFLPNKDLKEIKYLSKSLNININQDNINQEYIDESSYSLPLLVTLGSPLNKLLDFFADSFNEMVLNNYKAAMAMQIAAVLSVASLGSVVLASHLAWLGMIDKISIPSVQVANAFLGMLIWIKTIYLSCKHIKELNNTELNNSGNNNQTDISQKIIAGLSIILAALVGVASCLIKLPIFMGIFVGFKNTLPTIKIMGSAFLAMVAYSLFKGGFDILSGIYKQIKNKNSIFHKPIQGLAWFLLGIISATSMIVSTLLRGFSALSLGGSQVIANTIKPVISLFVALVSLGAKKLGIKDNINVSENIKYINNKIDIYNPLTRSFSLVAYEFRRASDAINSSREKGLLFAHTFLYNINNENKLLLNDSNDS